MFRLSNHKFKGSENEFARLFIEKYKGIELSFNNDNIPGDFFEQVRIDQIKRVSDLIVKCGNTRLINIEFKIRDHNCLLSQTKDHLKWADYSYACVPSSYLEIFPQLFVQSLLDNGIGLIVGSGDVFIEVFQARFNAYKNGFKVKDLRYKVMSKIKTIQQVQLKLM